MRLSRPKRFAPQLKTLHLAGVGLRQTVDELDPARIFPRTDGALHVHLDVLVKGAVGAAVGRFLEHDERLRLDQAVVVLGRHHRRLEHARMGDQRRLDFKRRHPDAAHLEHFVGAAAEEVNPVGAAQVFVAGARPLALEGAARFLTLIPISGGSRGAAHQHLADGSIGHILPGLVDKPDIVAFHRNAGGSVLDGIRDTRNKEMPYLGRPDAIDDIEAEALFPSFTDLRRQRLCG